MFLRINLLFKPKLKPNFFLSSGVLEEAEFYNIASLVRLVKERIRDNENRTSQVEKAKKAGISLFQSKQNRCLVIIGFSPF